MTIKKNTAASGAGVSPASSEWPTWQQREHTLPRVILSTGRIDIHPAFQSKPDDYLERFLLRPLDLFPMIIAAKGKGAIGLMLKAPAQGKGKNWHDQHTALSAEKWEAIGRFASDCIAQRALKPYLYTRPIDPIPADFGALCDWPTWRYLDHGFGLWLDSTAESLHIARDMNAAAAAYNVALVGIEGWGDLYEHRPGPALMNWRKIDRDDRAALQLGPRAWRIRERLSGTPWLYTLTVDPRSGEEIPLDLLAEHHALGRSVVCINPSPELAAEIDRLYSSADAAGKGGA